MIEDVVKDLAKELENTPRASKVPDQLVVEERLFFMVRYAIVAEQLEELLRAKPECFEGIPDPEELVSEMYNIRGVIKGDVARHEEAILDFDKAIKLNPDSIIGYKNRAAAKQWLGRKEEAMRDYVTALTLLEQIPKEKLKRHQVIQLVEVAEQLTTIGNVTGELTRTGNTYLYQAKFEQYSALAKTMQHQMK
ncbi:hypothetical protein HYU19_03035 [Candidatus Woesearchaeota archaeon]|nr:hypothetical protein [Candidatus Woesearchaeota archaeon]